ncbi:MAG: hypothetical protein EA419_05655 [Wenzhouxiangella sp.]|nr:MAG: hypothetical protein EA419_05655 [Wenzhouxiangella sp.]
MRTPAHFDLLILGGGCAGLSLAMRLAESGYPGRVAIIEPRSVYVDDRSWCFWAPDQHPLAALVSRRWSRWRGSRWNRDVIERSAPGLSYQYVNSLDFYQHALEAIRGTDNIELKLDQKVVDVTREKDLFHIQTADSKLQARWVVDTRPPAPARLSESVLHQCFAGRVVSLAPESPGRFEPDAVELMTDMRRDEHGLQFSYVLPFARDRALVEVTRFCPAPVGARQLGAELDQLLARRGWKVGAVEREESAVLPMGLPQPDSEPMPGMVRAGTGGGALRPASGYGFQRIQRWAGACSQRLGAGFGPLAQPPDSTRQRFMDGLFLQVLRDQPERAPELFGRMFERVPGPVFVRFMSDRAGWSDSLRIISSLPWRPFLQTLGRRGRPGPARLA